jgi:hypothetical protein
MRQISRHRQTRRKINLLKNVPTDQNASARLNVSRGQVGDKIVAVGDEFR